jgi:hypothetical protein
MLSFNIRLGSVVSFLALGPDFPSSLHPIIGTGVSPQGQSCQGVRLTTRLSTCSTGQTAVDGDANQGSHEYEAEPLMTSMRGHAN